MRSCRRGLACRAVAAPAAIAIVSVLSAGMVAFPAAASADTQPSHFIFAATSSNWDSSHGGYLIDNGATNDNPNAILFVTPNVTPGGISTAITVDIPIAVFYDTSVSEWEIVDDSGPGYSYGAGVSFNVLVVPSSTTSAFTLTSSSSNIVGDTAFIDSDLTNNSPSAILQVTQNLNPGGGPAVFNNEVPGVWYNGSQWGVFNESEDAMTTGASFNVLIGTSSSAGGKAATLKATASNREGDGVEFNNVTTNGDSNAFVLDTPNYDPKGAGHTIDASPISNVAYWGTGIQVLNGDATTMANHEAFNMLFWNS
jgi:hypothetical protein